MEIYRKIHILTVFYFQWQISLRIMCMLMHYQKPSQRSLLLWQWVYIQNVTTGSTWSSRTLRVSVHTCQTILNYRICLPDVLQKSWIYWHFLHFISCFFKFIWIKRPKEEKRSTSRNQSLAQLLPLFLTCFLWSCGSSSFGLCGRSRTRAWRTFVICLWGSAHGILQAATFSGRDW